MRPRRCFCYVSLALLFVWFGIFVLYSKIDKPILGAKFAFPDDWGVVKQHPKLQPRINFDFHKNYASTPDGEGHLGTKGNDDLLDMTIIKTPEDQKKRDDGYKLYAFNMLVSDRLSFHRNIPDTRTELCKKNMYPHDLPTASIIICFYNEAWSALLRTIYSVIDRSPPHLLHEIIIVDDNSGQEFEHLGKPLDDYIAKNFEKVKLIRTTEREGLIRARVFGADHATGDVLIFLDSHCEVNADWIRPLLAHIKSSRSNVAIPIIDIINHDTFQYQPSPLVRGGFNWGMHFRWDPLPSSFLNNRTSTDPIKSPTMAGGLFAIDRKYFNEIGKYDPGMDIWGGENLEISFRVWQCGGTLDIIPCSRVGHIFRKRRPYGSPDGQDTMTKNSVRAAMVWMDEYKEYYFKVRSEARTKPYGDISERVKLREHLKCKSFKWYLDNVYPEQTLPTDQKYGGIPKNSANFMKKNANTVKKGWLRHYTTGLCVVSDTKPFDKRAMLKLAKCNERDGNFMWYETSEHELLLANMLCMDGEGEGSGRVFPRLMKCRGDGGSQVWRWTGQHNHLLLNQGTGKCAGINVSKAGKYLSMEVCEGKDKDQSFALVAKRRRMRELPPG